MHKAPTRQPQVCLKSLTRRNGVVGGSITKTSHETTLPCFPSRKRNLLLPRHPDEETKQPQYRRPRKSPAISKRPQRNLQTTHGQFADRPGLFATQRP